MLGSLAYVILGVEPKTVSNSANGSATQLEVDVCTTDSVFASVDICNRTMPALSTPRHRLTKDESRFRLFY
jgi:hypothetical protein